MTKDNKKAKRQTADQAMAEIEQSAMEMLASIPDTLESDLGTQGVEDEVPPTTAEDDIADLMSVISPKKRTPVVEKSSVAEQTPVDAKVDVPAKPTLEEKPALEEKPTLPVKAALPDKPVVEKKIVVTEKPAIAEIPVLAEKQPIAEKPDMPTSGVPVEMASEESPVPSGSVPVEIVPVEIISAENQAENPTAEHIRAEPVAESNASRIASSKDCSTVEGYISAADKPNTTHARSQNDDQKGHDARTGETAGAVFADAKAAIQTSDGEPSDGEPSESAQAEPDGVRFADLSLSNEVQKAISKLGYQRPTEIQAEIIPYMLEGRDVLAQSQTGTGKTAAFAMPILSRIKVGRKKPQVLVLAPTRELAIQVCNSFSSYGSCLPRLNVVAVYGGQDYDVQLRQLRRGVEVVVGTPGRVIDHIKRGTLDLSQLDCLVLDEADEMLNMGFLEDVEFVLEKSPKNRQVALFSATLPKSIRNIAERYLNDPAKITIKRKTMTADSIRQRAVFVPHREKTDMLARFLEVEQTDGVLVFTRTKDSTVVVAEQLVHKGLSVCALNGDMPQRTRERTIERLKAGKLDIVVATDVAARGLDVNRISHVFNYDFPEGSESYVHRVGRTGRAGRKGEAIIFLTHSQKGKLRMIERVTKQSIEIVNGPSAADINEQRVARFKQQIIDIAEKVDLTVFEKMISKVALQSEIPMEKIAAAIAHMGQRGKPFFAEDRPRHARKDRDRKDQGGKGRRDRTFGPPEEGMTRYRIAVGHNDGVRPGNIVGAVANEAGIDGSDIGPIKIHGSFSTIDLPNGMPQETFDTLEKTRVVGKQLRLKVDQGKPSGRSNYRGSRGGRSNDRNDRTRNEGGRSGRRGKPFNGKRKSKR